MRKTTITLAACAAALLGACSAPGSDSDSASNEDPPSSAGESATTEQTEGEGDGSQAAGDATLSVWVDETRTPAVQQYASENPDVDIDINTIPSDAGYANSQIALANQAGEGWPDVLFLNTQEDVAALASDQFENFPLRLDDKVDAATIDGFAEGALDVCTFEGEVFCMRNDIGQTVLWYNKPLMEEFGYEVPETWEEYAAIGEAVAAEHPGYVIGGLLGKWGAGTFFTASGCQTRDAVDLKTVVINTETPECVRVAEMLSKLLTNDSVVPLAPNDPAMAQLGIDGKVLMFPGPSWYGDFIFTENGFNFPDGALAAAEMPVWEGSEPRSGSVGGGAFVVSRHSEYPEEAIALAEWLATDIDLQASNPTYPAYAPAAEKWCEAKATSTFYAEDPCPVLKTEAGRISERFGAVRYVNEWSESFNQLFVTPVDEGGDPVEALTAWGEQLKLAAEDNGYEVVAQR